MYILGVHNCYDAGAALFKDSELLFAVNEERLTRIKMDDAFPEKSIQACLDFAGIALADIDLVSYAWHHRFPYEKHLHDYVKRAVEIAEAGPEAKRIMLDRVRVEVERSVPRREEFERWVEKNGLAHKVEFWDHHHGHAAQAYYASPFDEALVFTLDASGNFRSGSVSLGRGNTLEEISTNYTWDSIGFFYGQITELLGFKPHRHEGKVTGLAAFGNPETYLPIMQQMIRTESGKIYGHTGTYYKPFFFEQAPALKDALKDASREDIAAALQRHTEDVVTEYISYYVREYGIGKIACAGGVFANVKLNQRIRAISGVTDLYVFPHMGDGGLSVGGCLLSLAKRNLPRYRMERAYLGNDITDADIRAAKETYKNKVTVTEFSHQEMVDRVVQLIKQGTIIGVCQGRMEYGPRALGNRSVIYHAKDRTVNDWLNKRLRRTEFMPFAPFTTKEIAPLCFLGWQPSHNTTNFMTECYECTDELKAKAPAIVHVDGTARPQIVAREDNPFYYDVVDAWHKETGGLCLINTSFNEHEQPIVATLTDAIDSLLADNVDVVVACGKYLIERKF